MGKQKLHNVKQHMKKGAEASFAALDDFRTSYIELDTFELYVNYRQL